MQTKLDLP